MLRCSSHYIFLHGKLPNNKTVGVFSRLQNRFNLTSSMYIHVNSFTELVFRRLTASFVIIFLCSPDLDCILKSSKFTVKVGYQINLMQSTKTNSNCARMDNILDNCEYSATGDIRNSKVDKADID